jgi:hypothetical protein
MGSAAYVVGTLLAGQAAGGYKATRQTSPFPTERSEIEATKEQFRGCGVFAIARRK